MRGTYDKASGYTGAPTYSYDEPAGYYRTPFGLRPTLAKRREDAIRYYLRGALLTGIVILVGLYMYAA
jgi:hypothetical protein